ncbi:MAG: glycosyltransferase [Patescibacteria group bacterium]
MTLTLSVVIPTKNEEKYLPNVLQALGRQTFLPTEIIVADAASSDTTRDLARRAGAKVVDGGLPSVGRNRGAAASTSDLIFFLDADVVIHDDRFLEKAIQEFVAKRFDIVTADVAVEGGMLFDKFAHRFYNVYVRILNRFHPHAPGFCILVRRSLHEAIEGFDETVLFCEDHDYACRAAKKGKFGILNSVMIFATTRRQERDGRLSMSVKYILAELHIMILGPIRHDWFKYGFGYDDKK